MRLVVCGTDTDVGKTIVSAWLVQGLKATYWKPVQSGLDGGGDRERIRLLLNLPRERLLPEAYAFTQPVSPHWAAELDQHPLDPERLNLPETTDNLVVETAGGVMVPLTRSWRVGDVVTVRYTLTVRFEQVDDQRAAFAGFGTFFYGPLLLAGYATPHMHDDRLGTESGGHCHRVHRSS